MVLNFGSTGEHGQAVYGGTNSQVAGANGAIATTNPNSVGPMQGGKRRSRKNKNQQGGKRRQQSQRQNKKQRQNKSKRQRGGK